MVYLLGGAGTLLPEHHAMATSWRTKGLQRLQAATSARLEAAADPLGGGEHWQF